MPTKSYLLWIVLGSLSLASCNEHFYYAPNTLHMPQAKNVGEVTLEGSLNGSNQAKGFEVKGGYGIAPKTSIMVNAMYLRGSFTRSFFGFPTPPSEEHSGRGYFAELGATRHFPISEYTDFTLSAGGGLGQSNNFFDRGRQSTLNFNRFFLQPGIVTKGELANIGVGLRYSRLGISGGSVDLGIDEFDLSEIKDIENKGSFLIPDLGFSAGINFAPIHVNCNLVLSVFSGIGEYALSGSNLNVSLGYDIQSKPKGNAKKKKKK
jgi:hypothetical protein